MLVAGIKINEDIIFDEIDEKVKYINENKKYCEETIRQLNTLIDIDYIKMSEFIEGNTLEEIKNVDFDENTKVLRSYPTFIMDLPDDYEERIKFLKQKRYDPENSSLVIMKKGDGKNARCKKFVCAVPKHLSALEYALSRARYERNIYQSGDKIPPLDKKFIENINGKFFEKTEHKDEPGYGSFRRIYYKNGDWVVPDVMLRDTGVKLTRCELVNEEMESLLKWYNNSDLHPILKAIIFKVKFIKIHPFCDGNGRTIRILLNYMLVRYGYPTLTISVTEKQAYFDALNKANIQNDYTDIIKLIKRRLHERCDKYIQVINEQKARLDESENAAE